MSPGAELNRSSGGWVLRLSGDWRLEHLTALDAALAGLERADIEALALDGAGLDSLDSACAMLLLRHLRERGLDAARLTMNDFDPRHRELLHLVGERLEVGASPRRTRNGLFAGLGGLVVHGLRGLRSQLAFVGRTGEALGHLLLHPRLFRRREFFVQLEEVGLEALGIVALMTFLIGVVFAYLLAIQIEKYGANIFIVDGIGLAMARELSPMLTAILMAGRSGAAFTAQIGAMKVTEEIDAIATLGLSPVQVLVVPRLLAIVIAMPLLTFVGLVMGVLGAALVAAAQLDITFYTFFSRLKDVLPLGTVLFGLEKSPVFAAAIALIACRNGFDVSRDAHSVGSRTTSTVVRSLVAVILINAAFAVAFPEIIK